MAFFSSNIYYFLILIKNFKHFSHLFETKFSTKKVNIILLPFTIFLFCKKVVLVKKKEDNYFYNLDNHLVFEAIKNIKWEHLRYVLLYLD